MDRWMGDIFFPLTPALSLGERENRPPSLGHTRDGICKASVRYTHAWGRLFPLPEGEGQGEGKGRFDSRQVLPIQWTPQYGVSRFTFYEFQL
jgi:hypothetical protein